MKQRKRWLGLAAAPFALAMFAFAQPAHAADYTGDCASIPNHVTGNATVSDTTCVIDTGATLIVDGTLTIDADSVDVKSEIQSVGKVTVRTNGGGELKLRKKASSQNNDILLQSPQNRIDTKGLEAGNSVQVDAGLNGAEGSTWDIKVDGQIIVNKVQSSPTNPNIHANVLLRAAGPINTKTIKTDGDLGASSVKSGGVQIEAYRSGGTAANGAEFVIGGTGAANGVNGNIVTESTIGGGTSPSFVNGGLYVTMGGPSSTGNIRVADASAIKVRATQSRSGWIILNANGGTIFLPAGNLNTSGDTTNNAGAGLIYLMANALDTQPGTIISANQTETAAGTGHQIFICIETLKYRGNGTDGLKVLNDGNGGGGFFSLVNISPKGYLIPGLLTSNVNQMPWNFSLGSAELAKDGPLTIDGTEGNAQLVLRADGNTAAVNVSGYPLAFNGGDVTVRSRGQTLHRINVGFFGTVNGARQGLTVNNVGNWTLDANGLAPASGGAAAGGIIQVKADQSSLTALDSPSDPSSGNIVIRANGDDANGDGGIISVDTKSFVLGESTRAVINSNGAPNGTGNAINNPLDSAGPFAVTFKSGSTNMVFGGGNKAVKITATGGKTSGSGGTIKVLPGTGTITVRNSLALDASAIGNNCGASCDAGQIQVVASGDIKANNGASGAPLVAAIKANGAGSGTGGKIILQSTGDVVTEGSIEANGGCDSGDGGEITLTGLKVKTFGKSSAHGGEGSSCLAVAASANSFAPRLLAGSANGGRKIINADDEWLTGNIYPLDFNGAGDGNGGEIIINNPNQPVDLSTLPEGFISAKAGENGSGLGGKVTIAKVKKNTANGKGTNVSSVIKVDGGSGLYQATENDFGRVTVNNVVCQQRTTALAPWPKTYWNCQHPDGSTPADRKLLPAAKRLHATNLIALDNAKVQIHIMKNIDAFDDYHGNAPVPAERLGIQGYSVEGLKLTAVFFQMFTTTGPLNTSAFYSGTLIHEMAHQLNVHSWNNADASPTWLGHVNAATTAFDAPGLPPPAANNCPAVVDPDRTANGRSAICFKFDGVTTDQNGQIYPFKKNSVGLADPDLGGEGWFLKPDERFANAFAEAYRLKFKTDIIIDVYNTAVEQHLTDEQAYMQFIRDNGTPNGAP